MSNVSSIHTINPFVAGKSSALSGQRLAKVGYKSTAKNPAKFKSVCVSVPMIAMDSITKEQQDALAIHIRGWMEGKQDDVIRNLYESADGMLREVTDGDISIDSIIGYLNAESDGGRMTKEYLTGWFTANIAENLTVVIAEKLSFIPANAEGNVELTENQMETVQKHVNGYKDMIAALAGGKTLYQPKQCQQLLNALALIADEDDTSKKLCRKLEEMKNPKIVELLDL